MSNSFNRSGFEESVLYSNDDYEPYGYASPQVASTYEGAGYAITCPYEREIEAAVLRRLDSYPGC